MVQVIREASQAEGELYVKVEVGPKPSDPKTLWGWVSLNDPRPNREVSYHTFGQGLPVEDGVKAAIKLALCNDVPFVLIDDPRQLFPAPAGL